MLTEEATRDRLNALSLVLTATASHALSSLVPYLTAMKHAITMATIAPIITIISTHLLSFNMSVYIFISRAIHVCLLSIELCLVSNCVKQLTLKRNGFRCTIYEICEQKGGFMDRNSYIPDSPYLTDNLTDHPEELSLILSISKPKRYKAGGLVYVQGEESKPYFYLIEQGKVKISLLSKGGSERIIIIQEKNTLFGYAATFDGHPYFHTATALEETILRIIHINDFLNLVDKHPKVGLLIVVAFARVTRMLVLQIEDFSFLDAEKRVAHMIYKLAYEIGQKTPRGLLIAKKVTQEDIARLAGLSRVSVSLALNHLEDLDILRKKRNIIEVFDIKKLKDFIGYL